MAERSWTSTIPNLTVGIDLGDTFSDLCLLDGSGEVLGRERVRTRAAAFEERFLSLLSCRAVLEVGTHSPWVSRLLEAQGHEVIVANPSQMVQRQGKRRRKSNQLDAEFLARQGRADPALLFPIHHRGEEAQAALALVRARDCAVRARTQLINHVRGSVKARGTRLPVCSSRAFATKVRAELPPALEGALSPLLETIGTLTETIRAYDRAVERAAQERYDKETEPMRAVAGVGALTSLAFVLTLEDPTRFPKSRAVGAYLGLTPGLDETGEHHTERRISKAGDPLLRRLLIGSAQYILGPFGPDCELRRFGLELASRGGKGAKKRAVTATARKLSVLLHHLWRTGERYEPLRALPALPAAEAA